MKPNNLEYTLQSSTGLVGGELPYMRVAFDVGSATTKAKAAVFQGENKLVDLGGTYEIMAYQSHLDSSKGDLSRDVQLEGLSKIMSIICQFKAKLGEHIDVKVAGIATAWARRASNSDDYIKLLKSNGINVDTVTQDFEGKIGYKAALSIMDPDTDLDSTVVCDIGGGSFQIAFGRSNAVKVYHGKFGSANFFDSVKNTLAHLTPEDKNRYLNKDEVEAAKQIAETNVARALDSYMETYFGDKKIHVAGIGQFLNKGIKQFVDGDTIKLQEMSELMYEFCDLTGQEAMERYPTMKPEYVYMSQTNLILLEAMMKSLNVEEIDLVDAKATDYVLNDHTLWEDIEPVAYELVSDDHCGVLMDEALAA